MSPPFRLVLSLEEHLPAADLISRSTGGPACVLLSPTPLPLPWHRTSIAGLTPPQQPSAQQRADHLSDRTYGAEWKGLVSTLEQTLLLHQHRTGTLVSLDRYLHNRTGGMIGALSHQIRGAAVDAILTGAEKITKQGLAAVPLDYSAQLSAGGR